MTTQKLTLTGIKRTIEANATVYTYTQKATNRNLGLRVKRFLTFLRNSIKSIDNGLELGYIDKVESATRVRGIYLAMALGCMVKFSITDPAILNSFGIDTDKVAEAYNLHKHRTDFIVSMVVNNQFIQDAIENMTEPEARKPSPTRVRIESLSNKIDSYHEMQASKDLIKCAEDEIQKLYAEEYKNITSQSAEEVCSNLRKALAGEAMFSGNKYDSVTFNNAVFNLSKTAQTTLMELIVKTHNEANREAINTQREANAKAARQVRENTKELSAADKKIFIQQGKAEGLTQKEVAALLNCSERTVRNYWHTTL